MKKLKEYTQEELELMDYDDIAYLILEEKKKKMKINELFKKVCEILKLNEEEFIERLPDFFEILTTDKRFIQLTDGYWDLKEKHSEKLIIEDEEEESEDDLKDLVIIDEEDEEN